MTGRAVLLAGAVVLAGVALFAWLVLHGLAVRGLGLAAEPAADIAPPASRAIPSDRPARVLLLGTSLTAGAWPASLERRLSACRSSGVLVERLAKPGANSAWGAEALRARLAAGPAPDRMVPDLMIIEFSINDASLWRGMTLAASRSRHEAMLRLAKDAGVPVWLATMSPAFGRKAWERPGQGAYRALYADLAQEQGAGLIAMAPAWLALSGPDRQRLMPDGLHPTEAAMEALAVPRLAAALERRLCDPG